MACVGLDQEFGAQNVGCEFLTCPSSRQSPFFNLSMELLGLLEGNSTSFQDELCLCILTNKKMRLPILLFVFVLVRHRELILLSLSITL